MCSASIIVVAPGAGVVAGSVVVHGFIVVLRMLWLPAVPAMATTMMVVAARIVLILCTACHISLLPARFPVQILSGRRSG